jgi:dipeptide/tripeptide permease
VTAGEQAEEASETPAREDSEYNFKRTIQLIIIFLSVLLFFITADTATSILQSLLIKKTRKTMEKYNYLNDPDYINAMNELNKEFPPKNYDEENL